jgi:signal transduction histidine kinase
LSAQRHTPRPRPKRPWLIDHQQRLGYVLVALSLAVVVGTATAGGFQLHRSADLERQTLRTQMLGGLVFQVQDFVSRAQTDQAAIEGLAAGHARAVAAANRAFLVLKAHDPNAAGRIRAPFVVYLRGSTFAFARARADNGRLPRAEQRQVERNLTLLESRIDAEIDRQAHETRIANPRARFWLIAAAIAAGLLIALLIWQFEMQRRAGRIDRDHVERAEELMRLRDDFAAAVSHELRTPLTSILGYLELIRDDESVVRSAEEQTYLAIVQRNAERLLRLVSDLLLVAEVESGTLTLRVADVDLGALASECVDAAKPAADAGGIELTLNDGSTQPMSGDPTRLAQMLDNLVSNAIKFTPSGGSVTITTATRDGDTFLEVVDSGVGISPVDQTQLFDRFFRTPDAAARATPGTGLGLTITKAIVDAHGGTIGVTSTVGRGTTFTVRLPRARETDY